MPSGKTHDAVTLTLAVPAFIAAYYLTHAAPPAFVFTFAFLFGGLMFGPDLDTGSKQYWRWSVFRWIWLPYRALFRHRSRFTHGLIFGPLIRVVYFQAMLALIFFAGTYLWASVAGGRLPAWPQLVDTWRGLADLAYGWFGARVIILFMAGMWCGAASHTIADILGSRR